MAALNRVDGISGTLFPGRYLADELARDASGLHQPRASSLTGHLHRWWQTIELSCGPATGLRALFDLVAMPLFGMLGFRASNARFEQRLCRVSLETPGGTPVALLVLPWASRPSASLKHISGAAREINASWGFVLAAPFLSLVHTRGHAVRRSVDFSLSEVLRAPSLTHLLTLAHANAFETSPARRTPLIDLLMARGERYQDRVREDLQHGVAAALRSLMTLMEEASRGQAGTTPRSATSPSPSALDESLTLVYRILFLLFAESRSLVPHDDPIYRSAYAVSTLCRDALRGPSPGVWDALAATTRLSRLGCKTTTLRMAPFNGRLFARSAAPALEPRRAGRRALRSVQPEDEALRQALIALGSRSGTAGRESISYRDLGVEQLGAVYERVLDFDPSPTAHARPSIRSASGGRRHSHARKRTGTFYTPQPLAAFVVRRTLAPLVEGATSDAVLSLRVVDPAMGSGACLVAACHYLAAAYEEALLDEGRASISDIGDRERAGFRRLIAERCLAGVDRNPTAVQVARLSLWLTTLAKDKPLSFLDHRLRVGDSLVGAWPEDLGTLPALHGRRARNLPLFDQGRLEESIRQGARPMFDLLSRHDDTVADVRAKESLWRGLGAASSPLEPWRQAASLWCARWFWPASSGAPPDEAESRALMDALLRQDRSLTPGIVAARTRTAAGIAERRQFFHWPLEFPDVFYDADGSPRHRPGFDAVVGNPPWEMLRRDDHDREEDSGRLVRYLRGSGHYPSCDRGHLNLYQAFLDRSLTIARPHGRVGLVLPWSLASDDGASTLRRRLLETAGIDLIVGLDNAKGLFPIHRGIRFLVITASPGRPTREFRARFGVRTAAELDSLPDRAGSEHTHYPVRLTPGQLRLASGPACRIPDVRRLEEFTWLDRLAAGFPALGSAAGWAASFGRELNATESRPHFSNRGLPILEGKHLSPFVVDPGGDQRIGEHQAALLLPDRRYEHTRLAYRDVSGVGNRLTLIAAVLPPFVVTTHTIFCMRQRTPRRQQHFLCGLFNSYVLNAMVRMLMGGHVTTSLVEHLPVPVWTGSRDQMRIGALARQLARGSPQPEVHARLQVSAARLYGFSKDEFHRLMEGFPLVSKEERTHAAKAFESWPATSSQA